MSSSSIASRSATRRNIFESPPDPKLPSNASDPVADPPPTPRPVSQLLAFGLIIVLALLQFLPATHFRDASDPFRKWVAFDSFADVSKASKDIDPGLASAHGEEDKMVHIVSWMDCLDLRLLAILANSTLSSSRTFEEAYKNWKNNDKLILQVAGRTWAVYCSLNLDSNQCRISRGWIKFLQDNSLNVCDVCVFELIDPSKKLLQVVIFRAAKEKNCEESKRSPWVKSEAEEARLRASVTVKPCKKTSGSSLCINACRKRPKFRQQNEVGNGESDKDRALASANAFKSKNPFFINVMQPFHVNGGGTGLYITKTFEEAYKKWKKSDEVILQVAGRTWQVYCNVNKVLKQCRISRGWIGFVRDNSLNVGDVCVFELINPSRKLFNVFIFRAANGKICELLALNIIIQIKFCLLMCYHESKLHFAFQHILLFGFHHALLPLWILLVDYYWLGRAPPCTRI